jgi:hypothetical protein
VGDSLLFGMKVWIGKLVLVVGAIVGMSGCASIGPPEAPMLELPKPPTDLKAARKSDKVTLTWTIPARTTERLSVRYLGKTRVCRSLAGALRECGAVVGEVAASADFAARKSSGKKPTATFTDTLAAAVEQEHPMNFATYAVEVLNEAGRGAGISNQVRVPLVPTLPAFGGFLAQANGQGVNISWQCGAGAGAGKSGIKYLFRIYRRLDGSASETKITDVEATECATGAGAGVAPSGVVSSSLVSSFLDQTFEWEKTYFYRGTVVSVIEEAGKTAVEVEGDDTPEVKVFAHDVFPPAVPAGLQAVFSGPGQAAFIDLIWTPVGDSDLAGYNVYRHEAGGAAVKLNAELVKTPGYRDAQVVAGKIYFYSVSAVDERGNESGRSEETSESVGNN